jgi:hypothetical protein
MRLLISAFFILTILPNVRSQKLSLDDLLRTNSKGITEIRKTLKSKGFSLKVTGKGAHGESTYTWLSKDGFNKIYFRELDLDEESSSLSYSPISDKEYKSLTKEVLNRGFKRVPYFNSDPSTLEIISYKKGKIDVSFYTFTTNDDIHYEIAVSD